MSRRTMRQMVCLTLAILGVAWACAPAARHPEPLDDPLATTLNRLKEHEAAQEVGSVSGHLFFSGPDVASRFTNAPVSLIPLTPDLEAAITQAQQEYLAGRRVPLTPKITQARGALLDSYIAEIQRRAGAFVRATTTDDKDARFEFEAVPQGRWLLVAGVASPVSVLYWAVPVEILAGTALQQNLSESNFWIEGLK